MRAAVKIDRGGFFPTDSRPLCSWATRHMLFRQELWLSQQLPQLLHRWSQTGSKRKNKIASSVVRAVLTIALSKHSKSLKCKFNTLLLLLCSTIKSWFFIVPQDFLRHLLQEAAVESGESTDREEHLERHRRVLQTRGWVAWAAASWEKTLQVLWAVCLFMTHSNLFFPTHAESEVCKLETLLQNEVSVVAAGEAVGADAAKTPPSLRRRKRACSRRQGDKEKEREVGGSGPGDRGDRGVGEERDRREAGESKKPKIIPRHPLCNAPL